MKRCDWSVYILLCGDGSYYTGATNNVDVRLQKHQSGSGGAYTRSHLPLKLVYAENNLTRSGALKREAEIKRLSRSAKMRLAGLPAVS